MPELYLRLLDRLLTPVLLILAAYLFLRGHNEPGGGFIAGLAAASAIQLQILSLGDQPVRERLGRYLHPMTGIGLLLALASALVGLVDGGYFKSVWWTITIGEVEVDLGTPLFFDLGVFIVVFAVIVSFLLSLSRQDEEAREAKAASKQEQTS